MAAAKAVVYVSTTSTFASTFSHSLSPSYSNSTPLERRKRMLMCAMPRPQNWRESRRLVAISLVLLHSASSIPPYAIGGSIFDKYVKKKKLEPLEAYVPAVILTELQIKDLEKLLESNEPQYATCRSILRSGPAASFRSNVRAVAQYASDAGKELWMSLTLCFCVLQGTTVMHQPN
uniref:DUF7880 domain-containing protein n=1 Tax=Opuntia streptacantha TaxID=393608 RepID=A0A7C8YHC7_OPUST